MPNFVIKRDNERYKRAGMELPAEVIVPDATLEQAEELCWTMSVNEPGCDDLFYIHSIDGKEIEK